METNQVPENRP